MTTIETPSPVTTMPRIGDTAPAFTAQTTQGEINFPADYAGKWVILFSHPADFTPVCTSEFMTFATMQEQFAAYHTELVGLSVDGLYSHIALLRTIKDKISYRDMKDVEVMVQVADEPGLREVGDDDAEKLHAAIDALSQTAPAK
jgi:peroxiredoxin 2/4